MEHQREQAEQDLQFDSLLHKVAYSIDGIRRNTKETVERNMQKTEDAA